VEEQLRKTTSNADLGFTQSIPRTISENLATFPILPINLKL
jgi:hypothetical protein